MLIKQIHIKIFENVCMCACTHKKKNQQQRQQQQSVKS